MSYRPRATWPLILAYHSVSDDCDDSLAVRTDAFRRQIGWLAKRGYRSTTVSGLARLNEHSRERIVIITFDDGYRDNYTAAAPILREFGFTATIFVVCDAIGRDRPFWWDEHKIGPGQSIAPLLPMGWDQARSLAREGFEIGSHSRTHPDRFRELSAVQLRAELVESKRTIEGRIERPVESFSYPRGSVDAATIEEVEGAGYQWGVVTPPRGGIPLTRYSLRRAGVYRDNSDRVFRLKTSGTMRFLGEQVRRYRRTIPAIPA